MTFDLCRSTVGNVSKQMVGKTKIIKGIKVFKRLGEENKEVGPRTIASKIGRGTG